MTVDLLGTSLGVFIGITVFLVGTTAFMTGQAVATSWKPPWQLFIYCLLLGGADRFLTWGLFQGELFLLSGYLIDTAVILVVAFTAYRLTLVRRMTAQYPWMYERAGVFSWRERRKN